MVMKMYDPKIEQQMSEMISAIIHVADEQSQEDLLSLMDHQETINEMILRANEVLTEDKLTKKEDVDKISISFEGIEALIVSRALVSILSGLRLLRLSATESMMNNFIASHDSMMAIQEGRREPHTMAELLSK